MNEKRKSGQMDFSFDSGYKGTVYCSWFELNHMVLDLRIRICVEGQKIAFKTLSCPVGTSIGSVVRKAVEAHISSLRYSIALHSDKNFPTPISQIKLF